MFKRGIQQPHKPFYKEMGWKENPFTTEKDIEDTFFYVLPQYLEFSQAVGRAYKNTDILFVVGPTKSFKSIFCRRLTHELNEEFAQFADYLLVTEKNVSALIEEWFRTSFSNRQIVFIDNGALFIQNLEAETRETPLIFNESMDGNNKSVDYKKTMTHTNEEGQNLNISLRREALLVITLSYRDAQQFSQLYNVDVDKANWLRRFGLSSDILWLKRCTRRQIMNILRHRINNVKLDEKSNLVPKRTLEVIAALSLGLPGVALELFYHVVKEFVRLRRYYMEKQDVTKSNLWKKVRPGFVLEVAEKYNFVAAMKVAKYGKWEVENSLKRILKESKDTLGLHFLELLEKEARILHTRKHILEIIFNNAENFINENMFNDEHTQNSPFTAFTEKFIISREKIANSFIHDIESPNLVSGSFKTKPSKSDFARKSTSLITYHCNELTKHKIITKNPNSSMLSYEFSKIVACSMELLFEPPFFS